ncbi:MAG: hypothetical protein ABMA01_03400, partial [Chthoniobacteraceae bacterium]
MKPNTDPKKQPQQTPGKAFSRRRLKTFMDELKERPALLEQFESIMGIAAGGDGDAPIRTADEIESLVIDATRKLGNSTMQQWAQGAQQRAIESCKKEHPKARLKKSTLSWWCMFGEVRIEEITLRAGTEHHLRPFAGHAKVSGRCKSLRLERAMCDFGIEDSFASANKRLLEHYGFKLHAGAMRSATLKHAARAEIKLKAEYAQPYRKLPAQGAGVIIAEADGSMLCTVPEGLPRKATRPRAWQEIRLLASQRQGSVETTYAATFESVQEAGVRWGHTAKEAGRALQSRIHAVCDGAEWIALQTREVFGADATLLTDFYHVSEYLAAAAPACRPAAPGPWRHTQQKRLKRGASAQVIAELAVHREAAEVADENAPVRAAHRY